VQARSAGVRVGAAVKPCGALKLPPDPGHAVVEIDVLPAQAERFPLPETERQTDRPARGIRSFQRGGEDRARLVLR
jgi:hypothetical protein